MIVGVGDQPTMEAQSSRPVEVLFGLLECTWVKGSIRLEQSLIRVVYWERLAKHPIRIVQDLQTLAARTSGVSGMHRESLTSEC